MRLLGTLTELSCRAGPLSLAPPSPEPGDTHSITGWVVPSSWLSTWDDNRDANWSYQQGAAEPPPGGNGHL